VKQRDQLLILFISLLSPSMAHAAGKGAFFLAVWAVMVIPFVLSVILVGKGLRIFWSLLSLLVCALSAVILWSETGDFLHFIGFALPVMLIPLSLTVNRVMSRLSGSDHSS